MNVPITASVIAIVRILHGATAADALLAKHGQVRA